MHTGIEIMRHGEHTPVHFLLIYPTFIQQLTGLTLLSI